jgi:hypothetical protein
VKFLADRTAGFAVMVNERLSFEENRPQKSGGAAGDRNARLIWPSRMQAKALRCIGRREGRSKIDRESQP